MLISSLAGGEFETLLIAHASVNVIFWLVNGRSLFVFCLLQELKKCYCSFVRSIQVYLKLSILIFQLTFTEMSVCLKFENFTNCRNSKETDLNRHNLEVDFPKTETFTDNRSIAS